MQISNLNPILQLDSKGILTFSSIVLQQNEPDSDVNFLQRQMEWIDQVVT